MKPHSSFWLLIFRYLLNKRGEKGRIIFSDDKNWFPISSRMAALSRATQAIWSTLLRQPEAVDQADSCRNLDESSHWRGTEKDMQSE